MKAHAASMGITLDNSSSAKEQKKIGSNPLTPALVKIYLEGNTSNMHAIILLQMVCNTIVCGHRDYPNNIADVSIGD